MEEKRQVKTYLTSVVNPILKPLVQAIVTSRPNDILTFVLEYAKKQIHNRKIQGQNLQQNSMNSEGETMTKQQQEALEKKRNARMMNNVRGKKNSRKGISAQAYGQFNKKVQFKPKVYRKSEQSFNYIRKLLLQSFMFQSLSEENLKIVIEAMQQRKCLSEEQIISEGDAGDMLYIIGDGEYECTKLINGQKAYLKTYKMGDLFGQLSLMYNTKRAASIRCTKKGILFALDRSTFNNIVQESAIKRRKQWQIIIQQIDILSEIHGNEKQLVCDALKQEHFDSDRYVVKEGQDGDRLYFIMEGNLVAEKVNPKTGKPQVVLKYKEKQYFGEISLIRNTVRQASIKTLTKCKLLSVGREQFKRLLGPVENILQRNIEKYKKFLSK